VGVVLYLLLSLACTAVYSPLGVAPAEVGLDYGSLLAQSAVGVAATAVVSVLAGLAVVVFRLVMSRPSLRQHRRPARFVAGVVAIVFVLDLVLTLPVLDRPPLRVAGAVVVIGALAAAALLFLASPAVRQQAQREGVALAPTILVVIVLTFGLALGGNAVAGADDLRHGRRPSALFIGIPAPWRAETARVTWLSTSSSTQFRFPDCLLYLGEAEGTAVFYDARRGVQEALRVDARSIMVAITQRRPRCPV